MSDEPTILAGRYEVGDLIGRGGMAEVHIGYDTRLGRTVAIKILRPDLARDPSFQTRFRREAQAAAGLNHPSIVAVYDTGEESITNESGNPQSLPFIVMEYVEGHTVRDILKGDVAAPIDEAIEIVSGVLSGLDYAHHAGLVHRDIKPANVMLTPTGAVKVMDFGIARALADSGQTMTQTQAVVGTAQYLSPEQARGESVDARSDLYSTGCLLFELLTGRPPFIGDSPVSVAYQHVREAAPNPSEFASDVPKELDQIVQRALAKDRAERYSSAQEFLADLQSLLHGEPVNPSTGAIPIGAAAVAVAGAAATRHDSTQVMTGGLPATQVMKAAGVAPAPGGGFPATPYDTREEEWVEDDGGKRRIITIATLIGAGLLAILLIFTLFKLVNSPSPEPTPTVAMVTIPDLVDATEEEAVSQLEQLTLVPTVEYENSDEVAQGIVIRTEPPFGEQVEEDSAITVVVSSGASAVAVPDVRAMTTADAVARLERDGFQVATFEDDNEAPNLDRGRATRTEPAAGEIVDPSTPIVLWVATGFVELPDLVDSTRESASSVLATLGLTPAYEEVPTADKPPGTVLSHDPPEGLVPIRSTVAIRVAVAQTLREVPNVVGMQLVPATNQLSGAGFLVNTVEQFSIFTPSGEVISQNPAGNSQAIPGSTVTITVSKGPDPGP